jgi:hypothetical protein
LDFVELTKTLSDRVAGRRRVFYNDKGTRRVIYELPPTSAPDRDSVLVFSLPRAGSVLLEHCVIELSAAVGLPYISIAGRFFDLGLLDHSAPRSTSRIFAEKGYCYGGFRGFPSNFKIPIIRRAKKILQVRDPRDLLTSHYFSLRESHPPLGKVLKSDPQDSALFELARTLDIDSYVDRVAPVYKQLLAGYRKLVSRYDVRLYRYESIVYDKVAWINSICNYYDWNLPQEYIRDLAAKHDIFPSTEASGKHIRQVHPGDYTRKLKRQTIELLTRYFADDMRFFGYSEETIRGEIGSHP